MVSVENIFERNNTLTRKKLQNNACRLYHVELNILQNQFQAIILSGSNVNTRRSKDNTRRSNVYV